VRKEEGEKGLNDWKKSQDSILKLRAIQYIINLKVSLYNNTTHKKLIYKYLYKLKLKFAIIFSIKNIHITYITLYIICNIFINDISMSYILIVKKFIFKNQFTSYLIFYLTRVVLLFILLELNKNCL